MDENLYSVITEFTTNHLKRYNDVYLLISLMGSSNGKLSKEILDWANEERLYAAKDNRRGLLILNKFPIAEHKDLTLYPANFHKKSP